jgi:hypothetical protein
MKSEKADSANAKRGERALIAFLRAELALGFTYANSVKAGAGLGSDSENRARELAKDAVETIRWFGNRINDPAIQRELQEAANELEKLLAEPPDKQI